ncbi:hypothetical protein [Natrinema longum]|uniref:hypothetical protein n=1 Tax=Natrinema longum TaxID=370324 RepID=UPI001CCB75E2|nr:hypothetical protein [Natrinema longum]MBZ6496773.1 hypothetical protein [Natrinema longum]
MAYGNSSNLAAQEEIENTVLDAVQKGLTQVSDLVSYCGPELIDVNIGANDRELDVPQVSRAIENMVQRGLLERHGKRGLDQLQVRLTEEGRATAPPVTEREAELMSSYGVSRTALQLLANIRAYESRTGRLPTITQLRDDSEMDLVTYQIQPLYSQLLSAGLADDKGLFRFKIRPNQTGETALEEFEDLLE